jgi:hypothetical protein
MNWDRMRSAGAEWMRAWSVTNLSTLFCKLVRPFLCLPVAILSVTVNVAISQFSETRCALPRVPAEGRAGSQGKGGPR